MVYCPLPRQHRMAVSPACLRWLSGKNGGLSEHRNNFYNTKTEVPQLQIVLFQGPRSCILSTTHRSIQPFRSQLVLIYSFIPTPYTKGNS